MAQAQIDQNRLIVDVPDIPEGLKLCQSCERVMTPGQLAKHVKDCKQYHRFTKKFQPGYLCLFCEIYNEDLSLMFIHLKRNHSYQIDSSLKKFTNEAKKLITVGSRKPGPKSKTRKFKCNLCPVEKSTMAQIVLHLKQFHPRKARKITTKYFQQKLCKTYCFSNQHPSNSGM